MSAFRCFLLSFSFCPSPVPPLSGSSVRLLPILFILSTPLWSPAQEAKLRIALIPLGASEQVKAVADLLTPELTSGPTIELLD